MKTLSELIGEKNALPPGNVYKKTIAGRTYYYYQFFQNGTRIGTIVSIQEAKELSLQIKKRKELEKLIKDIQEKDKGYALSKNAKRLTGYVMSGNTVVAEYDNGNLISIDESKAPLIIKRTHSLERFLRLRVIDMSRTNARILKKILNINVDEDYEASLYVYALSISDNYWFKPKHSKLKYQDLIFNNDIYFDASLKGDTTIFPHQAKLTPELTTTGSFEKGWKYISNKWWLYKNGNDKQIFSELFCYHFATLIGIPTARYEYDNGYIRSLNFADKYTFEPIASLADNNDNYEYVYKVIEPLGDKIIKQYLSLIFFDSVVYNIDRHNENLGLLRDKDSGEIISLAPNFDNNMALISSIDTLSTTPNKDPFVKIFIDFIKHNEKAMKLYKQIKFKDITKEDIYKCVKDIPITIKDIDDIVDAICIRYNYLKNLF